MKRKNIAFNKHMVVQQDVEQCLRAAKRVADLWQIAEEMLKRQTKVGRLLSLETWEEELFEPQVHFSELRELCMHNVQFQYANVEAGLPLAIDLSGTCQHPFFNHPCAILCVAQVCSTLTGTGQSLVFKPGKIYGIVGANEAGKSML